MENLTNATLNKTGVPGLAISVVYKDQIVYLKGFGVRETGKPDLVDPDTVFQLASVSKPIASTIVAGVVGKGLVKWDDPIIQHDPSFQNDYFGKMAIAVRDGQLVLLQGSNQKAFPLEHYNGNVFTYQPDGENAYGLSAVTFTVGADGSTTNVTIVRFALKQT